MEEVRRIMVDNDEAEHTQCPYCGLMGPHYEDTDAPADYCSHDDYFDGLGFGGLHV